MRMIEPLMIFAWVVAGATIPLPASAIDAATTSRCNGVYGHAEDFEGRRTFLWRPAALRLTRDSLDAGRASPAAARVIADADAALSAGPWSVVDKTRIAPGADRHDYASMGPYWWPDPDKPDGLPYVRRDGDVNPERDGEGFDLRRLEAMSSAVEALALAHYLTDDQRYADRAALVLQTWFIAKETRMNPNMDRGQSIPGRTSGRAEGLIDLRHLIPVVESIGLIAPGGALSDAQQTALRDWFSDLTLWMATSPIGREERAAKNNHGIFYDLIMTEFALFSGHQAVAETVVNEFPQRRIASQFASDGSLPRELQRTRSFHYSTWTMGAAYDLATLGDCVGKDLWNTVHSDGRGLPAATAFLSAYAGREQAWKWPEKRPGTREHMVALRKAAWGYRDRALSAASDRHAASHDKDRMQLLLPLLPAAMAGTKEATP